jgi:ABC-type glycerol-3-phosphate transport system substrate-binding protein
VLDSYRFDGKLYAVPSSVNGMFYFYRRDLFEEKGLTVPATFEEWLAAAEALHSPMMSGAVVNLKRIDAALNEAHYYMNAFGDGWFDASWKPIFNSDKGVAAIERLQSLIKFAQRGYASSANDEAMITFQQGLGATGIQWFSRAGAMDDPEKSKVIGKIDWAVPPGGNQRIVVDGFAISKFSKNDKDTQFRVLATAMSEANQRAIASDSIPSRTSVLNDSSLHAKFRHYPAALSALQAGRSYPALPEFVECGDFITLRIQQAMAGEMSVKQALDTAAEEVADLLSKRGY